MRCVPFNDGKVSGIVCTGRDRRRCACGGRPDRLCDWKVKGKPTGTCDRPVCLSCTHSPALGKDLCPKHAAEWKARSHAS